MILLDTNVIIKLIHNKLFILSTQPESVTAGELMEFINLHKKVSEGEKAIREGRSYTLAQAKEMLKQ